MRLGESLMADGMHDLRDSDRALQDLLGVYAGGKLADGALHRTDGARPPVARRQRRTAGREADGRRLRRRHG
ncbi:hypothetical protein LP419_39290 [Massilia sp. H-1]|nr:hypothetical protein LP419_39290 [Massilia sp. H-1]